METVLRGELPTTIARRSTYRLTKRRIKGLASIGCRVSGYGNAGRVTVPTVLTTDWRALPVVKS